MISDFTVTALKWSYKNQEQFKNQNLRSQLIRIDLRIRIDSIRIDSSAGRLIADLGTGKCG